MGDKKKVGLECSTVCYWKLNMSNETMRNTHIWWENGENWHIYRGKGIMWLFIPLNWRYDGTIVLPYIITFLLFVTRYSPGVKVTLTGTDGRRLCIKCRPCGGDDVTQVLEISSGDEGSGWTRLEEELGHRAMVHSGTTGNNAHMKLDLTHIKLKESHGDVRKQWV